MFRKVIFLFLLVFPFVCNASEKYEYMGYITACPEGCVNKYDADTIRNQMKHQIYEEAYKFDYSDGQRFSPGDADIFFSAQFLKTAFDNTKDNFVISPLSVYAASTLLANGTKGDSFSELGYILGLKTQEDDHTFDVGAVNRVLRAYMAEKKQFEINNSIWGNDFKKEYVDKMKKDLLSVAKPLPDNTSAINKWISEKTKGRIQNLLGDKKTENGDLYLVNTVYFKDEWQHPFDESGTQVAEFYSLDGQTDKVDMMSMGGEILDYYEDDSMQVVRLPYKNGDVMHVFLPKEGVNFNQFIQDLSAQDLYLAYYKIPVYLELPRFNLEYRLSDMQEFFKAWGVQKIFNKKEADLFGLSDFPHYVFGIIHQSTIGVNEKGTEASAATFMDLEGIAMFQRKLSRRSWSKHFIANRPFVFMINNGDFIGVYVKGASEHPEEITREEMERELEKILAEQEHQKQENGGATK